MPEILQPDDPRTDAYRIQSLAESLFERLSRTCGATLPPDVLGYYVKPCGQRHGHEGEHQGLSPRGEVVRWDDYVSPWGDR